MRPPTQCSSNSQLCISLTFEKDDNTRKENQDDTANILEIELINFILSSPDSIESVGDMRIRKEMHTQIHALPTR